MIEIVFTILIAGLFFWDLITFYKKENIKVHRIIVPVGLIGSLISVYLSNQPLSIAVKNSLGILITSLLAFLIIVSIKLFLNKNKDNSNNKNSNESELKEVKIDEINEVSINLEDILERLSFQDAILEKMESEMELLKKRGEKEIEIPEIDLTEISEIKEILEFWTKRFDEDTKLFHTETMNLKKENKKQLELIIRLISTQSKQIDSKIKFFEEKLHKIENKKVTIDDKIVNNLMNKIESYLNHIKIEISTITQNFDKIYSAENNFMEDINRIENQFKNLIPYIQNLEISFQKFDDINENLIPLLNQFYKLRTEFEIILQNLKNNSSEFEIKENQLLKNIETTLINIEEKLTKTEEETDILQNQKIEISKNSIALNSYKKNLENNE